jgi:hypothetical protein
MAFPTMARKQHEYRRSRTPGTHLAAWFRVPSDSMHIDYISGQRPLCDASCCRRPAVITSYCRGCSYRRRGLSQHTTDASGDRTEDKIGPTEQTEIVKTPPGRAAGTNRKTVLAGRPESAKRFESPDTNRRSDSRRPTRSENKTRRSADRAQVQRADAATVCGTRPPPTPISKFH